MSRFHIGIMALTLVLFPPHMLWAQEAGEPAFMDGLDDIPLMPGLYELPGEAIIFDKPDGRIAAAEAATDDRQPAEIQSFYRQTLPQLGWNPAGPGNFIRDEERLKIAIRKDDSGHLVQFTVTPWP